MCVCVCERKQIRKWRGQEEDWREFSHVNAGQRKIRHHYQWNGKSVHNEKSVKKPVVELVRQWDLLRRRIELSAGTNPERAITIAPKENKVKKSKKELQMNSQWESREPINSVVYREEIHFLFTEMQWKLIAKFYRALFAWCELSVVDKLFRVSLKPNKHLIQFRYIKNVKFTL